MVIVLLGLFIRLYGISSPLVDSHQIRQAQTAMMARNLYDDNMDIFHTRLDFFGNAPGHIIMEFPLMHGITALLYYPFGVHETIGRLVSVAFSIGAMFLMYGLGRHFLSVVGAFAALALFVFSPMNIFFSRAFMPESSMMFFSVAAVYLILKWLDEKNIFLYVAAIVCAAFACLSKPTAGLIFAPILAAWFFKHRWNVLRNVDFWIYLLLSLMPLILWGAYANYFNWMNSDITGSYGSWSVVITGRGGITKHWVDPSFYTAVGGSVIMLLLTPIGFIGMITGIIFVPAGEHRKVLYVWLGAIVAYFYILAGPIRHIYYQLPLLPVASILFGFAVEWLVSNRGFFKRLFRKKWFLGLGVGIILLTLVGYGAGYFKYFLYMYDTTLRMPYVLEVSKIIKEQTPENRVILLNQPRAIPAVLTYYSQCKTWYFLIESDQQAIARLEHLRARGATTYVAIDTKYGSGVKETKQNTMFWRYLCERYMPIAIADHYLVFDLTKSKN